MDFAAEFQEAQRFLTAQGWRVAVIGGVALAAYGHPRMTLDLDLVTDASGQDAIVTWMESRGFATLHRSAGYSNHLHQDRSHGRVDFMYVRDRTADLLFEGVHLEPGPGGLAVPVPKPEHLIAMKARALAEAPERGLQDLADVGYLLRLPAVDLEEVKYGGTSLGQGSRGNGMSSSDPSDANQLDIAAGVPTSAEDIAALRRARRHTSSWLSLPYEEIDALLPAAALARRPPTSSRATPFTLP